ncbi:hypothetical protein BGAPBR_I0053 (plasmid) [Borreliella garinii PBr]|uniref:Uncharacterized protein n=1 Tax=Borreliella garinii PBr TaxID=498743 RepID=B8F132_BORGR|nr:hypothetical protein BGAPBR_I0053 [Borreliella garinii PBr]
MNFLFSFNVFSKLLFNLLLLLIHRIYFFSTKNNITLTNKITLQN